LKIESQLALEIDLHYLQSSEQVRDVAYQRSDKFVMHKQK